MQHNNQQPVQLTCLARSAVKHAGPVPQRSARRQRLSEPHRQQHGQSDVRVDVRPHPQSPRREVAQVWRGQVDRDSGERSQRESRLGVASRSRPRCAEAARSQQLG